MSFTVVTNVFCDGCNNWDSESGGAVGGRTDKREAWELAKREGWKKVKGKHHCPKCLKKLTAPKRR